MACPPEPMSIYFMAIFRKVHTSFWSDSFVQSLTPEQKYFYLYLLTNEKTKQCGIYDISKRQMSFDTGYTIDTVSILLEFFISVDKIRFSEGKNEIAIKNWNRYNGSTSPKVQACINQELESIKDRVLIEYVYSIDTVPILDHNKNKNKNKKEFPVGNRTANKQTVGVIKLDHNGNPDKGLKGMVF